MKDKKIEDTIKNILPNNDRSKLINCSGDDFFKNKKMADMFGIKEPAKEYKKAVNTLKKKARK